MDRSGRAQDVVAAELAFLRPCIRSDHGMLATGMSRSKCRCCRGARFQPVLLPCTGARNIHLLVASNHTRRHVLPPFGARGTALPLSPSMQPAKTGVARGDADRRSETPSSDFHAALEIVLATASDGILILDENERIVAWNRRLLELWKLDEELLATRDGSAVTGAMRA